MTDQHKLILVYGAGSGFGKSTLSQALAEALRTKGQAVDYYEEHDIAKIESLQLYVGQVHAGFGDDTVTLLAGCKGFIDAIDQTKITIIDSLLPCWDWLASADCEPEKIESFTHELCQHLAHLNPLLVLVEGDLEQALGRAVADRGEDWGLTLAEKRTGVRSINALAGYFLKLRSVTENSLKFWLFRVIPVNTVNLPVEKSVQLIAEKITKR